MNIGVEPTELRCERCGAGLGDGTIACDNCGTHVPGRGPTKPTPTQLHIGLTEPMPDPIGQRWQYAVVNIGSFNSPERMAATLDVAGSHGWELITVYDKASNWFQGWEKGFMLMKRPVPPGHTPSAWCVLIRS